MDDKGVGWFDKWYCDHCRDYDKDLCDGDRQLRCIEAEKLRILRRLSKCRDAGTMMEFVAAKSSG